MAVLAFTTRTYAITLLNAAEDWIQEELDP